MKEHQVRSVRYNFIMNVLLTVSRVLFPLVTFPYVSRILLPVGMGKISFATSLVSYFSMLAQLGIPTYGIRACAKVRDDRQALSRTVHELLGISLGMTVVSYVFLFAAVLLVPRLAEERTLFLVLSCTVLLNSIGMEWLYQGLEQYSYITVRTLVCKLIALIATFLLVRQQSDYVLYGGISILAALASNLLNFLYAGTYIDFQRPKDCQWKQHVKPVLTFFAMSCAVTIYTNLDAVMLGFMSTDAEVGYYTAAVKVKGLLVAMVTALGTVLLPRSSYLVEQGEIEQFHELSRKALHFVLITAMPLTVYFMLFAKESILFLSGGEFLPSVLPMQIIMPTVLFIGITNILGIQTLVPLGKETVVLYSVIAGAVTDLVLNFILIPKYQASGAAIGTLVAEAVVLIVQYTVSHSELNRFGQNFRWLRLVAALLTGTIACLWVKKMQIPNVWKLVSSALFYYTVYWVILSLQGNDIVKVAFLKQRKKS